MESATRPDTPTPAEANGSKSDGTTRETFEVHRPVDGS